MSRKIIGVTVGTTLPKPNFKQTDPTKGDYIKNKPDFDGLKSKVETIDELVGGSSVSSQISSAISALTSDDVDIYVQNDEPVDAPEGAMWLDTDENGEDEVIHVYESMIKPAIGEIKNKVDNKEDAGTASSIVSAHNISTNAHSDIRQLIDEVQENASINYNESIIGLSVDGQTVTYIKGDGSAHTIVTQDTNTTYSIGTDETTGLTKLYATTGSAEDGTMTQKAIKTELDKKVGVRIDSTQNMLVFTI